MIWKNQVQFLASLVIMSFLFSLNLSQESQLIVNETILEEYFEPGIYEVIEDDPDLETLDTSATWKSSTSSSELNQTFENFTLYAEMMRAQTESNIPFNPNYIYEVNENEVMPNISRRSYPVEIEFSQGSFLDSYIVELCENATENDHQELLMYIKMNDLNNTLENWFTLVIDDLWMPVNETHRRWILITNETTNEAIYDLTMLSSICYVVAEAEIETSVILSRGLDRIDQIDLPLDGYYNGAWINKNLYDGRGVRVFVFDSGLTSSHQEFKNKPVGWAYNTYDHYNCPSGNCYRKTSILYGDNDDHGHGTHVAGTVGGKNVGVAPGCMIHGVKVLKCCNSKGRATGQMGYIISAISRQMTEFRNSISSGIPVIVSMSLGGSRHSSTDRAIRNLYNNGILSVVSAGNDGVSASLRSPAGEEKAITVMASYVSGSEDKKVSWSNTDGDIYAPGAGIYSAYKGSSSSYTYMSGTSMSTPHVSGILACHYQYNKKMSPLQAKIKLYTYSSQLLVSELPKVGNIISGGWLALLPRETPPGFCHRGLLNGDVNYCRPDCKCVHGEGNCGSNECVSGTYCAYNYGRYFGMDSWTDVCVSNSYIPPQPTPQPTDCHGRKDEGDTGYCKENCQCQHEQGQCSSDSDCIDGTRCLQYCTLFRWKRCWSWKYKCVWKPTPSPTLSPTPAPTLVPIPEPTPFPTVVPNPRPTMVPISVPTPSPTLSPTPEPTMLPIQEPTPSPTLNPTSVPTLVPIPEPTPSPTVVPNPRPTMVPISVPTMLPTPVPTETPTLKPTLVPTSIPSIIPSPSPSRIPTPLPTNYPSLVPTPKPTPHPTGNFVYIMNNYTRRMLRTGSPTLEPTISSVSTSKGKSRTNINNLNMLWIMLVIISCSIFQIK